jgi:hypothetical protein
MRLDDVRGAAAGERSLERRPVEGRMILATVKFKVAVLDLRLRDDPGAIARDESWRRVLILNICLDSEPREVGRSGRGRRCGQAHRADEMPGAIRRITAGVSDTSDTTASAIRCNTGQG